MRRLLAFLVLLAVIGLALFLSLTRPGHAPATVAKLTGDPAHGAQVFWAGGCAACHAAEGATGDALLQLGGGQKIVSAFGTFYTPNISPAPEGLGRWTLAEFADAMLAGTGRTGAHLYPAFPYTSYARMAPQDVADLWAYLRTLPPVATPSRPHEVPFPFSIRALLGGWKMLFFPRDWAVPGTLEAKAARGRYLAEALVHCGECHTPRNALGGMERSRWLAGGPNPNGKGMIPNITPARLDWSEEEIVTYLTTGMTPDYDSVGGHMAFVVDDLAKLPVADVEAIAAYLKVVPPVP